ncbi:prepilin-type N-terminal cleavage/methylation domain-containing protein [Hydrogenophaga crocea]|uniref:Prepilin-type N-terminal cleavage/methylation domain-containing protein n=1 Tax=Hydrogenophaga crocea TaxID=2716225 RepID=A0A6G8IDW1_9BURK|nr:prepilin-type N-terminal cleavage/methylation domain-containing protein [Hydrogenophaga crocea]QIM51342.1 prepilin-type N-terminal cleavage/methylation domain-containing protein [Hydrogenophaga crocea]
MRHVNKMRGLGAARQHARGFSLIELMVALVLGLVIVGGVVSLFVNNQQAARTNEGLGRLQENARTAFELLAREIRQVGGNPCGAVTTTNALINPAANWWSNWDGGVLRGFDETQDTLGMAPFGAGVGQRVAGTHALIVLSGGMFNGSIITNHTPANQTITLNSTGHGLVANDLAVVCDGESAALVQLTAVTTTPAGTVRHQVGGTSLNSTVDIGFPAGTPKTFQPNGLVTRYTASFWYVGNNPRGGRSLYRMGRNGVGEEIADGVSNMQVGYLTRNQGNGNLANDWVTASAVTDWTNAATNLPVAVRLTLTLSSADGVGVGQVPLQRQVFHVINLRNRPAP